MLKRMIAFALILFLSSCKAPENKSNNSSAVAKQKGPVTENVELSKYSSVIYISVEATEEGNGSEEKPFNSIAEGLKRVEDGNAALLVATGIYEENSLDIKAGIELFGGYCPKFQERNIEKYITIISGSKKGRIMKLANDSRVDGFTLMGGEVKGKGAAIFTKSKNITISNNVITGNKTLKPKHWKPKYWHETANDGGAIYCSNEAEMNIINNVFINNQTENGRGGAIAADNKCNLKIENNVFFNNIAGLDDPMRSSDGGAVSIFRWSKADIKNNIFLSNTALARNDAGGVWVALWSSSNITNNIFVDNEAGDDAGAIFVGGQEHRYDAPLDPIPPKEKFFVSIEGNTIVGNRNSSMNSGAMRFTMESRGEFNNNISVFNNGIYFQRSEALISSNTILDNFLLIETKAGLKPCTVKDNIIWAEYSQEIDATVENNNMKYPPEGSSNFSREPKFANDGLKLDILSTNNIRKQSITVFTTSSMKFQVNQLVNRIVKVGDKWSIVKSNDENSITIWGGFVGEVLLTILPTYTVLN